MKKASASEIEAKARVELDYRTTRPLLTRAILGGHSVSVTTASRMSKDEARFWFWLAAQHGAHIILYFSPLSVEEYLDCMEANGRKATITL